MISRVLKNKLIKNGFDNVYLVNGVFEIDNPNLSDEEIKIMRDNYYDAFENEEEFLDSFRWPSHYWVEINGNILDITVDQFNEELNDKFPVIFYGQNKRYKPINKD